MEKFADDFSIFFAEDEVISRFLQMIMIVNRDSWPQDIIIQDVDVFNKNPNEEFDSELVTFVVVKPRTESCGKTDGCEAGCWRIIGRDKLLKSKDTIKNRDKVVGFKKILKFCLKNKPREYKRSWVMEEYRLTKNSNWNQDLVLCKIRCMFQTEISILLDKHFKTTSESFPLHWLLPNYGISETDPREEDEMYLLTIEMDAGGPGWPSYVTNNVYNLNPLMLVDPLDKMFQDSGICIFAHKTIGTTCKSDGGYWRVLHPSSLIKSSKTGRIIGFKKVFLFCEATENQRYESGKKAWIMEEYRLSDTNDLIYKVLNVIHQVDVYQR